MTGDRAGVHHLRVRYAETDRMGVAYHGAYVPWLEEARTEWMRAQGTRYRDLENSGLFFTVVRVRIRYRAPARYDDLVRIRTRLVERRGASVVLGYDVHRVEVAEQPDDGKRIADAEVQLALVDGDGRPTPLPEDLLRG